MTQHMVTRRQFTTASLAFGAGTLAGHVAPRAAADDSTAPQGRYIDMHVHLTQAWFGKERGPLTARHMVRWMDAHHIAQAVVLPLVSPEGFWYPITTEYVLQETRPFRDRLIPFCAIDPRRLVTHLTTKQRLVDMLKRFREAGALGFGEHKAMLPVDDPLNMRLYEACSETGLPVLFHLDNRATMDRPGLPGLARVLEAFPELVMIGHGKGWWASIAGGLQQADLHVGYPRGPVAPGGAMDALIDRFGNLYGDLSSSGAHAVLRDREFGQAFLERRADRLLFGTDYYDLKQSSFAQFQLFDEFPLPAETQQKIARDNARRILGLG